MAVRRRSNLVRVQSRRTSVWFQLNIASTAVAGDAVVLIASFDAAALLQRLFTVVRTRFLLHMESDQLSASENPRGALGMAVVSSDAIAVGVTAVPDSIGDSDAPWFVWQACDSSFILASAVGFIEPAGFNVEVDSKAMRKVGANEDVAIVYEDATAAAGSIVSLTGRMLVKLH